MEQRLPSPFSRQLNNKRFVPKKNNAKASDDLGRRNDNWKGRESRENKCVDKAAATDGIDDEEARDDPRSDAATKILRSSERRLIHSIVGS